MLVCDKCGAGINEGAKFCSQCGDPVTEADRVMSPIQQDHTANVEITFGQSSSSNFDKAIQICKNLPSYVVSGEGKQTKYKISLPITEVDLLINLYDLVGSWKSSQMLIAGQPASKKDLTYHGVGCYRNRQKAYKPDQYCFGERDYEANIWGCKKLNMPISQWGGGWLDYGKFDNSGKWHFDKNRIKHDLEIAINDYGLCPVLNRQSVFETLEKLPDSINPKKDPKWDYRTSYEKVKGEYQDIAVGIKPIIQKINGYVIGSYRPTWHLEEDSNDLNEITSTKEKKRTKITKPKKKSKIIWWVIGLLILFYFLGKS
ncbi:zinc ribbon domain-containing protein [Desulfoluna spongiiphila]|uniref:Zinc-ribbon domain-containing protein n=1 Tax=Desulfoluna spongiiphila TaxID=419481 RepID=A0A1G5INM7_9BACT|nr:zinc ribbon domain-containing protein [Desulfoluna spongiiphila]SCY77587.1 hypothetical protein SAMN05216233_1214 [Desulfoluna spongiiphila]